MVYQWFLVVLVKIGVNLLNKIAIFVVHFCIICCSIAVLNEVYDFCQMHNKMLTVSHVGKSPSALHASIFSLNDVACHVLGLVECR